MTGHTRRNALVMMVGGTALLATETAGFTSLDSLREVGIGVAPDADASLRIEGVDPDAAPGEAVYINPFDSRFVNRRDEEVELTVTSEEFTVQYLDEDGEPIPTDSITLEEALSDPGPDDPRPDTGIVRGSIDSDEDEAVTGSAQIHLEGSSFSLDFEREFSIVNPGPVGNLNLYTNVTTANTIYNPAGRPANNNQPVARWLRREESLETIDLRGDAGSRPTMRTAILGSPPRPAVAFTGTNRMVTSDDDDNNDVGTDLRRNNTPQQANVFFVFRPRSGTGTGGNREIFRLHQNENNTIRYRRDPGTLTVVLAGVERTITDLTTSANATHLLSLVFRAEGGDLLLEARRNGSQVGSTQNFGDVSLPDQPIVRIGSPNNASSFDMLVASLRVYHADQGSAVSDIESIMMAGWGVD